ncbi:WxL domain-containing protein [Xylocopilactobacillus apis]|uniref:WxL domain-containing protein n=1 Tax=Xylocopilactobacillus apis TaxID=2932183 RepID=A0AAU9DQB0_9LACO|nr:WxL domain-containing protein [Xylocopilactobacillus apis]BDR57293.1 hypothetical protein KIMC2_18550 [Xylocopilactobacillus apis]
MKQNLLKVGKLSAVALMAAPILSAVSGTSTVFAANAAGTGQSGVGTGRVIAADAQSVEVSNASGALTSGTSKAAIEFYAGNLSLDRVPNFDFGVHELQQAAAYDLYGTAPVLSSAYTGVATSGNASASNLGYYRMLQVTDKTAGSSGWKVTAWGEPFQQQNVVGGGTAVTMKPTDITLNTTSVDRGNLVADTSGVFHTTYSSAASDDRPDSIASSKIIFAEHVGDPQPSSTEVVWKVGNGLTAAGIAKGKGTWAADFNAADSATLNLPLDQQTTIGVFQSTLHWTLQAGV